VNKSSKYILKFLSSSEAPTSKKKQWKKTANNSPSAPRALYFSLYPASARLIPKLAVKRAVKARLDCKLGG